MKYEIKSAMIGYLLVTALLVIALIFVLAITYGEGADASDTPVQEVIFSAFARRGEDLLLTAEDGTVYKITGVDGEIAIADFSELCNGKTVATVYAKRINPHGDTPYFSVKAVYREGEALLDFSDSERLERRQNLPTVLFLSGMAVLWGAFFSVAMILARNPDRHSPRLMRLFFKPVIEEKDGAEAEALTPPEAE